MDHKVRLLSFTEFRTHAWYGKLFKKLRPAELALASEFLIANAALDKNAFELAVNRMFLGTERPKNYTIILELLSCSNSRLPAPPVAS